MILKIIDTPQFQRLRKLAQLGAAAYVFPTASHTRFQHSLGTCAIGGKMVELLLIWFLNRTKCCC
eukprot:UN01994